MRAPGTRNGMQTGAAASPPRGASQQVWAHAEPSRIQIPRKNEYHSRAAVIPSRVHVSVRRAALHA
jgi:hypothetical protein